MPAMEARKRATERAKEPPALLKAGWPSAKKSRKKEKSN
jgi:hypothetical protein